MNSHKNLEKGYSVSQHEKMLKNTFLVQAAVAKDKSGGVHGVALKKLLCEHLGKVAKMAEVVHKSPKG